jgi:chemotaxis protein CheX
MLSDNFTKIDQELHDGAAELLNIIFGQAKVTLNNQGYSIQKAIPSVISGDRITTATVSKDPVMVLPFRVEFGEFHVEICSEPVSA